MGEFLTLEHARMPTARRRLFAVLSAFALLLVAVGGCRGVQAGSENSPSASIDSASTAYEQGDFDTAVNQLESVIKDEAGNLEARRLLALAYAAKGENEKAVEQYQAVVDTDPEDHASFYRMALIERLLGKNDEAISHLEKAVDLDPSATYLDELARTYMQVGRYVDAASAWGKVLEGERIEQEGRVEILKLQADAYVNAKKYDEARASLEKALLLAPNDEAVKARLAELDQ